MKKLCKIITLAVLIFLPQSCFQPGCEYVSAWKVDNRTEYDLVISGRYIPRFADSHEDFQYEFAVGERKYINVLFLHGGYGGSEPEFEKLFGEYVPAYNARIFFSDPETGKEICSYELNHDADNVFSRDFFNEANWEVLDGAEFAAGEWKTGNGEPYRQWTFTVTDEYIK